MLRTTMGHYHPLDSEIQLPSVRQSRNRSVVQKQATEVTVHGRFSQVVPSDRGEVFSAPDQAAEILVQSEKSERPKEKQETPQKSDHQKVIELSGILEAVRTNEKITKKQKQKVISDSEEESESDDYNEWKHTSAPSVDETFDTSKSSRNVTVTANRLMQKKVQKSIHKHFELSKRQAYRVGMHLTDAHDVGRLHPNSGQQNTLDLIRLVGSVIFIADLGCKTAYPRSAKFATISIFNMYEYFVNIRIGFIVLYHWYRFCLGTLDLFTKASQQQKTSQILCKILDLVMQVILLPICMFVGAYRFVGLQTDKTKYYYTGLSQEFFLHQIPLTLLIAFNTRNTQSLEQTALQKWIPVFCVMNLSQMVVEWSYFKFYMDKGINLEQRIKLPEFRRIKDYFRYVGFSLCCGLVALVVGTTFYVSQNCRSDQYLSPNEKECWQCQDILGDYCASCNGPSDCTECLKGSYLNEDTGHCHVCTDSWPSCQRCSGFECLECKPNFFLDSQACHACSSIEGCKAGACGPYGCNQCEQGWFRQGARCQKCDDTMPGCSQCNRADICKSCDSSPFLKLQKDLSGCECDTSQSIELVSNTYGNCECTETDHVLTDRGCQPCSSLIADCRYCEPTAVNTGVSIHTGASIFGPLDLSSQKFLDCIECPYNFYLVNGAPAKCLTCESKWEGCSHCGLYGDVCIHCLNGYYYQEGVPETPCVKW